MANRQIPLLLKRYHGCLLQPNHCFVSSFSSKAIVEDIPKTQVPTVKLPPPGQNHVSSLGGAFVMDAPQFTTTGRAPRSAEEALAKHQPRLGYSKFYSESKFRQGHNYWFLGLVISTTIFLGSGANEYLCNSLENYIRENNAQAATRDEVSNELSEESDESGSEVVEDSEPKRKRVGFRDRKVIQYENRIRSYSTPDKIFRYFATLQYKNEIFMTPEDFVRSITPGVIQPEDLGLDKFKRFDPKKYVASAIDKDSVFFDLGEDALINFTDYVFLLTVLSTPPRQFEIAFRMFDLNGDGDLDMEEFDRVREVLRSQTSTGKRHRDHSTTGSTLSKEINSGLQVAFFGKDGQQKLTIQKMLQFQTDLQDEIMRLEFNRYADEETGRIRELDFAHMLLAYAGFSDAKKKKMLRQLRSKFSSKEGTAKGISFEDYSNFQQLLKSIADVDTALTFYHLAGASINPATLAHVTKFQRLQL